MGKTIKRSVIVMTTMNKYILYNNFHLLSANLSPCLRELRRALGYTKAVIKERFKPRCKTDGSYEKMQCLKTGASKETCWCVDNDGKEIIGSRVLGKAYCDPDTGKESLTKTRFLCPLSLVTT